MTTDLSKIDSARKMQASFQRQVNDLRRQLNEAQARERNLQSVLDSLINQVNAEDPDAAQTIKLTIQIRELQAELDALRDENAALRQQLQAAEQWAEWRNYQMRIAAAIGVDTSNPSFQAALDAVQASGGAEEAIVNLERVKANLLSPKGGGQQATEQKEKEEGNESVPQEPQRTQKSVDLGIGQSAPGVHTDIEELVRQAIEEFNQIRDGDRTALTNWNVKWGQHPEVLKEVRRRKFRL